MIICDSYIIKYNSNIVLISDHPVGQMSQVHQRNCEHSILYMLGLEKYLLQHRPDVSHVLKVPETRQRWYLAAPFSQCFLVDQKSNQDWSPSRFHIYYLAQNTEKKQKSFCSNSTPMSWILSIESVKEVRKLAKGQRLEKGCHWSSNQSNPGKNIWKVLNSCALTPEEMRA